MTDTTAETTPACDVTDEPICGDMKTTMGGQLWECHARPSHRSNNHYYVSVTPGHPDVENPRGDSEASLEEFYRAQVRLFGGYTIKLAPTERGVPDRFCVFPGGHMFLVELKAENGQLSEIQKHWHARIATFGAAVHVLYGRQGIADWVRSVVRAIDTDSV